MTKRKSLFGDKKGAIPWIKILIWAGIIIVAGIIIYLLIISPILTYNEIRTNINKPGLTGTYYRSLYKVGDWTGFNTNADAATTKNYLLGLVKYFWDKFVVGVLFIWHLFIGILAGFWIYLLVAVSRILMRFKKTAMKSQWLLLLGNNAWKVPAIGMGYAILLEVPIVNVFIKAITFEWPIGGLNWFLRSFVVAFYVALGPAWIESFAKYRLRIKMEKAVLAAKARAKLEETALSR